MPAVPAAARRGEEQMISFEATLRQRRNRKLKDHVPVGPRSRIKYAGRGVAQYIAKRLPPENTLHHLDIVPRAKCHDLSQKTGRTRQSLIGRFPPKHLFS